MTTNFDFLKKIDKNLFDIINEAEKLYRDEYFEQCMTQSRRFGENVCKKVLGKNRTIEETFDDMLATLKDKGNGSEQEKEFIDDLYYLKKHGNESTHSAHVKKDGMEALECLQRAFEVAINYAVYNRGGNSDILELRYDTELLVTGKKSKKSLSERYSEEKAKTKKKSGRKASAKKPITVFPLSFKAEKPQKPVKKKSNKQYYTTTSKKRKKGIPVFWIIVGVTMAVSLFIIFAMFLITL